jgi:hypothetical protein
MGIHTTNGVTLTTLSGPLHVSRTINTEYSEEQRWQDLQSLNRSHQELVEVMDVGIRNRDMLRAGEDHPAWLDPAHDEPIEDEQVNEVEDEKHTEGVGE